MQATSQPRSETCRQLALVEKSFRSYRHDEWDSFAQAGGGSFLGSWGVVRSRRLLGKVRLFDFVQSAGTAAALKVGQCAVLVARGSVTFLDGIHLVPSEIRWWQECFNLVVHRLGPGTYHYGSHWSLAKQPELSPAPSLTIESAQKKEFHIGLIDFQEWRDFVTYRRAVSENIRRDYRKAQNNGIEIRSGFGFRAFRHLLALVALRGCMMRRNGERFSHIRDCFLHAAKLIILGNDAFISIARLHHTSYAAFFGARFGDNIYYISGGTRSNRLGVGSYLFLNLIERWFSEHPRGRILMGKTSHTGGALLYRRKLRVRSVSGVEFELKLVSVASKRSPLDLPFDQACGVVHGHFNRM